MWALCVYVEAVSVLPQLRMMQKAKVVEKFTAHYVFALGLSRFISCAHWILQLVDGNSFLLQVCHPAAHCICGLAWCPCLTSSCRLHQELNETPARFGLLGNMGTAIAVHM